MKDSAAIKVCLTSRAPFLGGAEVACERLALGLQEAGHEVVVLLGQHGEVLDRFRAAGIRCLVVPMLYRDRWRPWRHFWSYWRVRAVLRREKPAVLHSNDLPTHQATAAPARALRIPRICHHRFVYGGSAIDWFNCYGAERHLFVSAALMNELCAASPRLAKASRTVLYDGLPLPQVPTAAAKEEARCALGLDPIRTQVLFAGQIIPRKGVADLLRAWNFLPQRLRDSADLVIAGDDLAGAGAYRKNMERLAAELAVPARFVGFQKNIPLWLTAADIVCVPSHQEPLGNATLEAMAHAVPVIGSRVGGIPEMIVEGETGLLVPAQAPHDLAGALIRLLSDALLRQRLGRGARALCEERFGLKAHTEAALVEYRRLLGSPQR